MNKKLIFLLILLFALQVSFAQNPIFKETKLFTLDNGEKVLQGNVYENGSWYMITEKGDKQSLIINGKKGEEFDYINKYSLTFTPDGKVVYIANNGGKWDDDGYYKGGKWYVVVNGKKGEGFDNIEIDSLTLTPDGKLVYIAVKSGKWYVVVNGEKEEGFDYIKKYSLKVTPDGKFAYVASNGGWWTPHGEYDMGKWYVVVNGKRGEGFDYIEYSSLTFTPDGKLAYIASNGGKWLNGIYFDGKWYVVIDGKKGEGFSYIYHYYYDDKPLKVTPDGKVVYIASNGGKWNYDGRYYWGGKWYVVVDGKKGEEFDYINSRDLLTLSPDGKVAYVASKGGVWDAGYGDYRGGKWYVVVNGKKGEEFDYIDEYLLTLSPDGKVVYIAVKSGKWYVVVDGVKGEGYDYIDKYFLTFTPDGKVVYIASNGGKWDYNEDYYYYYYSGGKYLIVLDNQESKPYDKVYDFKYLKEKDTLIALAKDGNDVFLVEYVNTK